MYLVTTDINMITKDGTKQVRRSWWTRIKSLKFWITFDEVAVYKPSPEILVYKNNMLIMHPATYERLKDDPRYKEDKQGSLFKGGIDGL